MRYIEGKCRNTTIFLDWHTMTVGPVGNDLSPVGEWYVSTFVSAF